MASTQTKSGEPPVEPAFKQVTELNEQFLATARELAEARAEAPPGEWEKIVIMGKQLAPEDPLFAGGAGLGAAAAGGVDIDLDCPIQITIQQERPLLGCSQRLFEISL